MSNENGNEAISRKALAATEAMRNMMHVEIDQAHAPIVARTREIYLEQMQELMKDEAMIWIHALENEPDEKVKEWVKGVVIGFCRHFRIEIKDKEEKKDGGNGDGSQGSDDGKS